MISHEYDDNEDAGDMRLMSFADYVGEMDMQSTDARRATYQERHDALASAPVWPVNRNGRLLVVHGHACGPRELPYCDECATQLERDNQDGIVCRDGDLLFCNLECRETYEGTMPEPEGREFPTYG